MESLLDYLDILEDIIDSSKTVPFSSKISVEKEKIIDLISEMRLNLPNEMRQAQRIIEDHDKIISDAKTKATSVLKEADATAKMMTNSHEVFKRATEQANEVMDETKKSARDLRLNAMDYADEILAKTEEVIRQSAAKINQEHRLMEEYFNSTIDILYNNRQELRGNKINQEIK